MGKAPRTPASKHDLHVPRLLWPRFASMNGCVLLRAAAPRRGLDLAAFQNRTAAEAFYNHLHVEDVLSGHARGGRRRRSLAEALGRAMAASWAAKLALEFPRRSFVVYLTNESDPIVRFHALRAQEPPWIDVATAPAEWKVEAFQVSRGTVMAPGHPSTRRKPPRG